MHCSPSGSLGVSGADSLVVILRTSDDRFESPAKDALPFPGCFRRIPTFPGRTLSSSSARRLSSMVRPSIPSGQRVSNPAMSDNHNTRVYDSMLGLLSGEDNPTPLVLLNKVTPFKHTKVYAKLEWYNPFGAVKDRVAANLIRDAEERGVLKPGTKLVEATSGNTGVGLIMMGNLMGYPLRTPLSDQIPLEKTHDAAIFWRGC